MKSTSCLSTVGATGSILCCAWIVATLYMSSMSWAADLPPRPDAFVATWSEEVWGRVSAGDDMAHPGEIFTATATLENGGVGEPRWIKTERGWKPSGTSRVEMYGWPGYSEPPLAVEVIDVSPPPSEYVDVTTEFINHRWTVAWQAIDPPDLPNWEPDPNPLPSRFARGTTFAVTLRVNPSHTEWFDPHAIPGWTNIVAHFYGNIGLLGWDSTAGDWIALNGELKAFFDVPSPQLVMPGSDDGSTLTLTLEEQHTGAVVPNKDITLWSTMGYFIPGDEVLTTGPDGRLTVDFIPYDETGLAEITVWYPGRDIQIDGTAHVRIGYPDYHLAASFEVQPTQVTVGDTITVTMNVANDGRGDLYDVCVPQTLELVGDGLANRIDGPTPSCFDYVAIDTGTRHTYTYQATQAGSLQFRATATGEGDDAQPQESDPAISPSVLINPADGTPNDDDNDDDNGTGNADDNNTDDTDAGAPTPDDGTHDADDAETGDDDDADNAQLPEPGGMCGSGVPLVMIGMLALLVINRCLGPKRNR